MAVELITGHAGQNHISSDEDAIINDLRWGSTPHWVGKQPDARMSDANTLTIGVGVFFAQGRYYILHAPEAIKIKSGQQGQKRVDGVWLRYKKDDYGVETAEFVVIDGVPGKTSIEQSPYVDTKLSSIKGDNIVDYWICTITVNGLTPTITELRAAGNDILTKATNNITTLQNKINEANSGITSLNSRMSTADTDRKSIWGNINTVKGDITSLKSGKLNGEGGITKAGGGQWNILYLTNGEKAREFDVREQGIAYQDIRAHKEIWAIYPPKNTSTENHSNQYWDIKFKVTNNVCMLYVRGNKTSNNWGNSRIGDWVIPSQYRPPFDIYSPMACTNKNSSTNTGDTNAVVKTNGEIWWQNKGGAHSENECTTTIVWAI